MPRSNDQLARINPNLTPAAQDRRVLKSMKHPEGRQGIIRYDAISLTLNVGSASEGPSVTSDKPIITFRGKWTGDPERVEIIEEKFLNRDQPAVGTCSRPIKDQNMGCFAHNGCPYPDPHDLRGRGPGPFNVIIEKDGQRHPCPCYAAYHGIRRGMPTSQAHYLYDGYTIDTETTKCLTTKARAVTDEWGNRVYRDEELEYEVENLGPMYAHHFGKKRQKAKDEKMEREEMDEVVAPVNSRPGAPAARSAPAPTVKLS